MAIEWLDGESFDHAWKSSFDYSNKEMRRIYGLDVRVVLDHDLSVIERAIPIPAETSGEDEPGPYHAWYGVVDGFYFAIVLHDTYKHAQIRTRLPLLSLDRCDWSILLRLVDLPHPFLRRIKWIQNRNEKSKYAVSYRDETGAFRDVYQARDRSECADLIAFLNAIGTDFDYVLREINPR